MFRKKRYFRIIECFEKTIFSNSYFRKIGNFEESATKKHLPKFWNSLKLESRFHE